MGLLRGRSRWRRLSLWLISVLPPPPIKLRKVFKVGGLGPDLVSCESEKSCKLGF
jgi:hypothetical protein